MTKLKAVHGNRTKYFLANGEFCRLPNSLDPDQDPQNVGPDHDTNHMVLC